MKALGVLLGLLVFLGSLGAGALYFGRHQANQGPRPVFQFTDAKGKIYFVDSKEKIPEEYRNSSNQDLAPITKADYKLPESTKDRESKTAAKQQKSSCPFRQ